MDLVSNMGGIETLTYLAIFSIFGYQVFNGVRGLREPETNLPGFQFYLFTFFLASELSRSFFPLFVGTLATEQADKSLAMAMPQVVWGFSALVATPYGWLLAKKIGNKNVLLASSGLTAVALLVTGLTDNYWVMLLCRALMSAGYGVVSIVAVIYLASKGAKASVMAVLLTAVATSSICGNSIGGLLTVHLSYSQIFWISALSAMLSAVVLKFAMTSTSPVAESKRGISYGPLLRNWKVQAFAVLNTMPYRFVLTGFVLYLIPIQLSGRDFDIKTIGQVMMVYFLLSYVLVSPIAKLLDRFENFKLMAVVSSALIAIGLLMFGHFVNVDHTVTLPLILVSVAVISSGMALSSSIQTPIVEPFFVEECEAYGRDALLAYFKTVERVGSVLGPLLTALLFKIYPADVLYIIGGVLIAFVVMLILLFQHRAILDFIARARTPINQS